MADFDSLWGEDFELPKEKEKVKKIKEKISKPKEVKTSVEKKIKSKALSIEEKLAAIKEEVLRVLGKQKDNVIVIRDRNEFHEYVSKCIATGYISVDTETNNSLNSVTCKIMGLCLYAPGLKQAYVPIHHRNPYTKEHLEWQLTEQDIHDELARVAVYGALASWKPDYIGQPYNEWWDDHIEENPNLEKKKVLWLLHNGKFDYEVIKSTCGIRIPIDWDSLIGAKLLDENERSARLKDQYIEKIDPDQEKYSIDHLFENIEYADVDPEIFALYAATDSLETYKLFEWQKNKFKDPDLSGVLHLANVEEMPLVHVLAEMQLAGMEVDQEYAALLSAKFHKRLDAVDCRIDEELLKMRPQIDAWLLTPEATAKPRIMANRQKTIVFEGLNYTYHPKKKEKRNEIEAWWEVENGTPQGDKVIDPKLIAQLNSEITSEAKSKAEQLTDPINLASPVQLAILFYDILKAPIVNKKQPRGTGEDELTAIDEKMNLPLCKYLLQRRELVKLLTTYIDTIPELAKQWPDGRVRTHFNQYGAATGRLSSSDPINFQNIPSHEKTIRMLFCAKKGYRILGADFSGQEPRLTAHYSNDENMIQAYIDNRDLYSVIASMSFDRSYEDCLEFYPEGTKVIVDGKEVIAGHKDTLNVEGKKYRTFAKSILLGILYGRGAASVGEQIGKTREEAQEIIDKFFKAFPTVQKWINASIEGAHKNGYVEDIGGRRRRLPDIQLPKYQIIDKNDGSGTFNPFFGCGNRKEVSRLTKKYQEKLDKIRSAKDYEKIQAEALKEGVEIHSNTGFIAQAERQAVNSRVQGGAATLTKSALLSIYRDPELRKMGAYLINTVHDEILIEAPEEYADKAAERLCYLMVNSAKKFVDRVPMSCDAYNVSCWYLDEYFAIVEKEFKKLLEKGMSPMDAFEYECEDRCESTRTQIYEIVKGYLDSIPASVDPNYKSL